MTKCIDLTLKSKEKIAIKFHSYLNIELKDAINTVNMFDNIELICSNYQNTKSDLMFAYNDGNRNAGALYLGYWNDGIVE